MTNKITKEFLFTELSIKIATLEMKLDKILELLNNPDIEVISLGNKIPSDEQFTENFK
jgi:hypothetical protein